MKRQLRWPGLLLSILILGIGGQGCEPEDRVETAFCQTAEPKCSERVISLINAAGSTIQCAVYTFTHDVIAEALAAAVQRGVEVWVIYEEEQENADVLDILETGGVYVKADINPDLMHHKFMIVDSATVVTGSFNWTYSADNGHDENLVTLHSPSVAAIFQEEFQRLWSEVL